MNNFFKRKKERKKEKKEKKHQIQYTLELYHIVHFHNVLGTYGIMFEGSYDFHDISILIF